MAPRTTRIKLGIKTNRRWLRFVFWALGVGVAFGILDRATALAAGRRIGMRNCKWRVGEGRWRPLA